jgi:hypothetical protein
MRFGRKAQKTWWPQITSAMSAEVIAFAARELQIFGGLIKVCPNKDEG